MVCWCTTGVLVAIWAGARVIAAEARGLLGVEVSGTCDIAESIRVEDPLQKRIDYGCTLLEEVLVLSDERQWIAGWIRRAVHLVGKHRPETNADEPTVTALHFPQTLPNLGHGAERLTRPERPPSLMQPGLRGTCLGSFRRGR